MFDAYHILVVNLKYRDKKLSYVYVPALRQGSFDEKVPCPQDSPLGWSAV